MADEDMELETLRLAALQSMQARTRKSDDYPSVIASGSRKTQFETNHRQGRSDHVHHQHQQHRSEPSFYNQQSTQFDSQTRMQNNLHRDHNSFYHRQDRRSPIKNGFHSKSHNIGRVEGRPPRPGHSAQHLSTGFGFNGAATRSNLIVLTAQPEATMKYSPQPLKMNGERIQNKSYKNDRYTPRNELTKQLVHEKNNDYVPSRFQRIDKDSDSDEDDEEEESDEDSPNKSIRYSKQEYSLTNFDEVTTSSEVKLDNKTFEEEQEEIQENNEKKLQLVSVSNPSTPSVIFDKNPDVEKFVTKIHQKQQEDSSQESDLENRNRKSKHSFLSSNHDDYYSDADRHSNQSCGSRTTNATDSSSESVASNTERSGQKDNQPSHNRLLSKVELPSPKREIIENELVEMVPRSPTRERIGEMSDHRRRSRSGSRDSKRRHYNLDRRHINNRSDYRNDRSMSNSEHYREGENHHRKRAQYHERNSKRQKIDESMSSSESRSTDKRNNHQYNDHYVHETSVRNERRDEPKTPRLRSFVIQN